MDIATVIRSIQKTNRCVAIEEGWPQSGVCSEIGMRIMEEAFDYLDAPVIRVTGKDVPMPYAANLEKLRFPRWRMSSRRPKPCCIAEHQDRGENQCPSTS